MKRLQVARFVPTRTRNGIPGPSGYIKNHEYIRFGSWTYLLNRQV